MQYEGITMRNSNDETKTCSARNIQKLRFCLVVILLVCVAIFAGCISYKDEDTYFQTDLFYCVVEHNEVQICELTKLGLAQEELLIPAEINGFNVKFLGWNRLLSSKVNLSKANTKKLFFSSDNIKIYAPRDYFPNVEKVILNMKSYDVIGKRPNVKQKIYVPCEYLAEFENADWSNFAVANVTFYIEAVANVNAYIHWVDDIEVVQKIKTIPPNPTASDSYKFLGWYIKDSNGNEQQWDFDNNTKQTEKLELHAKWEKING